MRMTKKFKKAAEKKQKKIAQLKLDHQNAISKGNREAKELFFSIFGEETFKKDGHNNRN
jgi:hypothetical protein